MDGGRQPTPSPSLARSANAVKASRESVRNGNMLSEPLATSKVFPPMVVRMIAIGERSGALESLLEKIAEFYDEELDTRMATVLSLVEPVLLVLMAIIVAAMLLAFYLPMFQAISAVQGGG